MRRLVLVTLAVTLAFTGCMPLPAPTPTNSDVEGDRGWVGSVELSSGSLPAPHCWTRTATVTRETTTLTSKACSQPDKADSHEVSTSSAADALEDIWTITRTAPDKPAAPGSRYAVVRLTAPSGKTIDLTVGDRETVEKITDAFDRLG